MSKKAAFVNILHRSEYQYVQNEMYNQYCKDCCKHYFSQVIYFQPSLNLLQHIHEGGCMVSIKGGMPDAILLIDKLINWYC